MSESYNQQDPQRSGQDYGSYNASNGQSYAQSYNQPYSQVAVNPEGQKHAQNAMIFGILSIVIAGLGVVFGPLALSQVRKAESYGAEATVGKVTGWIGLVLGILSLLFIIAYIVFIVVLVSAAGTSSTY
ncbi:MAG: DUF4190 domain-containing protein [Rothia sp. (in: high G+C Gram-positive bacteria)]|uniref:DUF4190 domain-containing protein n=1 Tax=Rothia sp. (in: high G+C Gram-positive bacteria) TaxID=1885016 RepID=UPI0027045281|nr:DUF4190 domain-containing protein [Rothia sp. (in: high G+C Gram-positive bacteria)]